MMGRIIFVCALFAIASAAVIPDSKEAQITKYDSTNDGVGNYRFSYETSNGITREETGHLVNVGQENKHMEVQGSYSYIDVDGNKIVVTYTAGENGYQVNQPTIIMADENEDDDDIVVNELPPGLVASLLGK